MYFTKRMRYYSHRTCQRKKTIRDTLTFLNTLAPTLQRMPLLDLISICGHFITQRKALSQIIIIIIIINNIIIIIIIIIINNIWSTVSGTALVNIGILTATVMAAGRRHSHCCSRRYCVIMGLGAHFPGLHTTRIRVSVSAPTLNLLRRLGRGDPHTSLQITSGGGAAARKFGNSKSTHQSALS